MQELQWIKIARSYIGTREIPGAKHNPTIMKWLRKLNSWINDDETPWCGTFVGAVLQEANRYVIKDFFRALSWLNGGVRLSRPAYGCLVIFYRKGGGHVGFCVGEDNLGRLMILGGNQGNAVNIKPFNKDRVVAYIWPADPDGKAKVPAHDRFNLPKLNAFGQPASDNEA